ncbi:hypothetical protein O7635_27650 [Asanoa sp. WMMD1127]|uniref:hypothetical protein n=1 Tax=Asanoa sp. WMMD1127 TaxID=3016107 RepID=UPI00241685AC|nr:hypothetical protein [Asanoa sp. WMMD1127]MDG4825639.1 hypothetical protein [Asanoa sp. WMMD1127]
MPGVEGAILFALVMTKLKASAGLAPTAAWGVALAASLAANPLGMYDAKSEGWEQISKRLDGMVRHIDQALLEGIDWVADDKDAFKRSLIDFKVEVLALKKAADDAGAMLAVTGTAFITTYVAILTFVGAVLLTLMALLVLRLNPITAAPATAMSLQLGNMISFFIAQASVMVKALVVALAAAVASVGVGFAQTKAAKDGVPTPERLRQLQIDYRTPTVFEAKSV